MYQVGVMTTISVFCLQSICWYWKNKRNGAQRPYVAMTALAIAICESMMWLTSCFVEGDYPGLWVLFEFAKGHDDLYFVFSFAQSACYLCLVRAIALTYRSQRDHAPNRMSGLIDAIGKGKA